MLYVALMTDLSLDLIGSKNTIVVESWRSGQAGLYASVLADLRPDQTVHTSANPEGVPLVRLLSSLMQVATILSSMIAPRQLRRP